MCLCVHVNKVYATKENSRRTRKEKCVHQRSVYVCVCKRESVRERERERERAREHARVCVCVCERERERARARARARAREPESERAREPESQRARVRESERARDLLSIWAFFICSGSPWCSRCTCASLVLRSSKSLLCTHIHICMLLARHTCHRTRRAIHTHPCSAVHTHPCYTPICTYMLLALAAHIQ
jgi:hypothetical protein